MDRIVIDQDIVEGYAQTLSQYQSLLKEAFQQRDKALQEADANQLLSIEQACAYLSGIDEDTLLLYRRKGLHYFKKGRKAVWYRKGDIDAWLQKGYVSRRTSSTT